MKKFAMEGKWMASVIDARSRTPTTLTFEGILNNNVLGTNIQPEVRYIFECLVTNDKVNENLSLSAWKSICSNSNLLDSRDDFLSIVRLVAFDSIIERNILIDNARTSLYESFAIKFTKRSKYFAWFLSTGALSFVLFELVTLLEANSTLQATVGNFGTILGIFGISALGQLNWRV
ncbi:MAG: hypothetical protein IPP17_29925 [Bacteroidetes bacterium]|nr:hypothetical protein [Bacteroidota bacterium]